VTVPDPLPALRARALSLTTAITEAPDEDTADRLADELDDVLDEISRVRGQQPVQHRRRWL